MYADTVHIETGMEVYGTEGEKLGKVTHVWPDAAAPGSTVSRPGYFQMEHGGILGVGAKDLYVPYSAVDDCVPGDCVTLGCAKDECYRLYAGKPDYLGQNA